MTFKEMYDHLSKDLKKVQIKEEYLLPKAIKELKKEYKFPAWKWYEYTIPSTHNKYIIFFYAENRNYIEKPVVDFFTIVFDNHKRFVIKSFVGGYKHTECSPLIFIRQIHAYTSHFFERYNERFLKDKSLNSNDIACRYLSRNKKVMPIQMNENINRHIKKYGDSSKYSFRVRDGFSFAQQKVEGEISSDSDRNKDKITAMLVLYTTFMNESNMKDSQIAAINKEHNISWAQYCRLLLDESKDGKLTFRLEK